MQWEMIGARKHPDCKEWCLPYLALYERSPTFEQSFSKLALCSDSEQSSRGQVYESGSEEARSLYSMS